jgi:ADP-ribose pyrophosphatase YjhB (NUDIX family)
VSSGGLVFKRVKGQVYFAMLKDSYNHWTFPKGHVRRGESYKQCAIREIEEELSLKGLRFIKPLGKIDIWFKDRYVFKGALIRKFIHYFLFEAPAKSDIILLVANKKGERIQDATWVNKNDIWEYSQYDDMKPIVRKALKYFEKSSHRDILTRKMRIM